MKVLSALIVLGVLCLAAFLGIRYWEGGAARRESAPPPVASGEPGAAQDAALGQFTPLDPPRPAPELGFSARDGAPARLADFRGRVVLVNLWATWCAPCIREMPSLDRLQATLGKRLAVIAISEDRGGAHVVDPFLAKLDLPHLAIYLDAAAAAQGAFPVRGLPTSFLIGADGRILGMLEGAATWDSPDMVARIEGYLQQQEGGPTVKASSTPVKRGAE
jgi:thiol-disulfide isomerase/thioredoxin